MRRCCMCKLFKPESDFAFRSLATGRRQDHCRKCHAAYRREHYLRNREIYIAREVARINGYRLDNRVALVEFLSARQCVDCGESDALVLEFDHRDPASKRRAVTYLAARKPWKFVAAEIAKCDVRCVNCHRRRTARQQSWAKARTVEPLVPPPPKVRRPASSSAQGGATRACTGCGAIKPVEQFSVKNKTTARRARRCHSCVAANSRDDFLRKRPQYLARARRNKRAYRSRNRRWVIGYLTGKSCVDCGETDPVVLEFDHRDGVKKEEAVSRLMTASAWATIADEIEKCDVRCANCHRRRTAAQFSWMKQSLVTAGKMASVRE